MYLCDIEKNSGDNYGPELKQASAEKVVLLHDNYGSFEVEGVIIDSTRYERIRDELTQNKRNLQVLKQDLKKYREGMVIRDSAAQSQDVDQPYPTIFPTLSPIDKIPKGNTMFGGRGRANTSGSTLQKPPPSLIPHDKKGNSATCFLFVHCLYFAV